MNKKLLSFMGILGSIVGSYVPVMFGDTEFLDGWSIVCGVAGGLFGIWLGVAFAKRFGW